MKTVWWLVDRQRVFSAIESELALLYPVRNPPHNAAEERRSTFLRAQKHKSIHRKRVNQPDLSKLSHPQADYQTIPISRLRVSKK